jgi:hypothetical protein
MVNDTADLAAGRRADGLIEAAVIDYSTSLARFVGGGDLAATS